MGFDIRHRFATIDGIRLHWGEAGESTGEPPLVLLHGLNDCHRTWRGIAPRFARDRRVLMPDLPGHGLSARPDASYELEWYARVVVRWLDSLGLESVDIAGHSLGGGIALVMLLDYAHRMRRLALVSSGGLGRDIAVSLRLASIPLVVERFGQPFMRWATRLAVRGVLSAEDTATLCAINAQAGSARAFARTIHDIIDWRGQRKTFLQRAHEIPRLPPIAVIWGDRDPIIPVSHAQAFADHLEGVHLTVLRGAGHYVQHEQPDAFVGVLRAFLEERTARPARLLRSGSHDGG